MKNITINPSTQFLNATLGKTNNSITMQIGDSISEDCESYSAQLVQQPGFYSIPSQPVSGQATAEMVSLHGESFNYVIGGREVLPAQNIYGNMQYGETTVAGAGVDGLAQGKMCIKQDGSVSLFTTDDNTPNGNGVSFSISPTGLYFNAPWGRLSFDATGLHISEPSGASLDMNGVADPMTGNAITMTTGNFTANAGVVNLGPTTGVSLPAIVSIIPAAVPGVPIMGAGVGAVVVEAIASPCVNICGIAG